MDVRVGQTVESKPDGPDGIIRKGIVRYVGEVAVQAGVFVGIELPSASGKNDGSVRGERYFQCPPLHGIFIKHANIARIVSQPAPKPAPKPAAKPAAPKPAAQKSSTAAKPRPSSIGASKVTSQSSSRLSTVGASKTLTQTRPPSGQSRPSLLTTSKAPSQSTTQAPSSQRPTSLSGKASSQLVAKRQSVAGSASTQTSVRPVRKPSLSAAGSVTARSTAISASGPSPTTSTTTTQQASKPSATGAADGPKIRQLEKQLAERDAALEESLSYKAQSEKKDGILQKLQTKCRHYHEEITALKEAMEAINGENAQLSKAVQENDSMMELATLDKEMAEERADQLKAELQTALSQAEEAKLELEIAQDELKLFTENLPEDDRSAASQYIHQKEVERLRNAIIMLRDMTDEERREKDMAIRELQAQLDQAEEANALLRDESSAFEEENTELKAQNVELREQVDANNEWEDVFEGMTEKVNALEEKNARLDLENRELETICEVSNETIAEYVEHTEEIQGELELRNSELAMVIRESDEKDQEVAELKVSISRYHEALLEYEANRRQADDKMTMNDQERKEIIANLEKTMEVSRRIHAQHVNSINKTISSELTKLSAARAHEELDIVKNYLPASSTEYMTDSLRAYFRATQIASEAPILTSLLVSNDTERAEGIELSVNDVYRHDTIHHLNIVQYWGEYFRETVSQCTLEQFNKISFTYDEMSTAKKTLDQTLDGFKKDEVKIKNVAESIRGTAKIMSRLPAVLHETLAARPHQPVLYASSMRSTFERIRAYLISIKISTQRIDIDDDNDNSDDTSFIESSLEPMIVTVTSCVTASTKLVQALATLRSDSLYPVFPDGAQELAEKENILGSFADNVHNLAADFVTSLASHSQDPMPINRSTVSELFRKSLNKHIPGDAILNLLKEAVTHLAQWHEYSAILMNNAEIERQPAPWVIKAQEIEATKRHMLDAEKKLHLLTTEYQSTLIQIREREEIIDTKQLEIDHLRAKHKDAAGRAESLGRVEAEHKTALQEITKLKREVEESRKEMWSLKEKAEYPPLPEPPVAPSPLPDQNAQPAADIHASKVNSSTSFITFVQALSNENHWLRQRENSEMLGITLKDMFTRMRKQQAAQAKADLRHKQARAVEMLEMTLGTHGLAFAETPQRPTSFVDSEWENDEWTPDAKSTPLPRGLTQFIMSPGRRAALQLTPIHTNLTRQAAADIPDTSFSVMEDLSFVDLSPVAEEFATEVLEGFSEIEADIVA